MDIKELLVDGSTKKVYATAQNDQVIVAFNDVSTGKGKKKSATANKAEINNAVSAYVFEYLESYNVPTHFIRKLDDFSFLAKKADMVPLIISVYNIAAKTLVDRFGMEEGKVLEYPVVEMYFKDKKKQLLMINEYHAYALGLCERKEMTNILRIATKVNAVLKSFFDRRKLKLIGFRLEFGRSHGQIVVADEVSLDTLDLWLVNPDGSFEKLPASGDMSVEVYGDLKNRILG